MSSSVSEDDKSRFRFDEDDEEVEDESKTDAMSNQITKYSLISICFVGLIEKTNLMRAQNIFQINCAQRRMRS